MKFWENEERRTMGSFVIYTHYQILLGRSNQGELVGWGMWHAWDGINVYRVLVGKPEGKRALERTGRRWENGIKMDLREIG
jgi:hypothetical protein